MIPILAPDPREFEPIGYFLDPPAIRDDHPRPVPSSPPGYQLFPVKAVLTKKYLLKVARSPAVIV
jgi:hypothetical protein